MSLPVTFSRCSYAPGLSRISRVLRPAVIANGLPDKVPACNQTTAAGKALPARLSKQGAVQ